MISLCHTLPVWTGRKKQALRPSVNLETGKMVKIKVGLTLARQSHMSRPDLALSGGGKRS